MLSNGTSNHNTYMGNESSKESRNFDFVFGKVILGHRVARGKTGLVYAEESLTTRHDLTIFSLNFLTHEKRMINYFI